LKRKTERKGVGGKTFKVRSSVYKKASQQYGCITKKPNRNSKNSLKKPYLSQKKYLMASPTGRGQGIQAHISRTRIGVKKVVRGEKGCRRMGTRPKEKETRKVAFVAVVQKVMNE